MPVRPTRRKSLPPTRPAPRRAGASPAQGSLFGETARTRAAGPRVPARDAEGAAAGPSLRAWVDGGARGNPGPAGYGAYIEDEDGNVVAEVSGFLGVTTNNVAEYRGLLAALRAANQLNARSLVVHADSELVVKQMNGQYKVKHEKLRPLFLEAQALAARLPRFAIRHVRREQNRDADRLANEAMDRGV
jgi:ribonuclease HI